MQRQMNRGRLLDVKGRLEEPGYATALVKAYDRSQVKASALRLKEWDYYLIYNGHMGVALTLADNGYMGFVSGSILDFTSGKETTASHMTLFPMGKMKMPGSSAFGDCVYGDKDVSVAFTHEQLPGLGNCRRLRLEMKSFAGKAFSANLILSEEPRDSMVIATPFKNHPKAFYYNQKIIAMKAEGEVRWGDQEITFERADSFGMLDWGRGVWTYDNTWYWSAAQGHIPEGTFGFNLGYGFGDTSAATENMVFLNGVAHKLEQVTLHVPVKPDGTDDYMKPWRFSSSDGRFEADFVPVLDRAACTNLGVLISDQHQVFGYFSGTCTLDSGHQIQMDRSLGFAEKVRNKW